MKQILSMLVVFLSILLSPQTFSKTVLIIESYHSGYEWDQNYKQGLKEELKDYELIFFEMDTKRLPEKKFQEQSDKAWSLYNKLSPDLVILGDDNAVKYLSSKLKETNTPVVYLGLNSNPRKYGLAKTHNFSGIIERPLLRRSILLLQEIVTAKKVLVLLDSGETSRVIKEEVFYGNNHMKLNDVFIDIKTIKTFSDWQKEIFQSKQNGYTAVIAGLYQTLVNDVGVHVDENKIIEWTSKNTQIPSFGFWYFSVGKNKNIGGYVLNGYDEGLMAGKMAKEILKTNILKLRHITGLQGSFIFSKSGLKKWGLKVPKKIEHEVKYVD